MVVNTESSLSYFVVDTVFLRLNYTVVLRVLFLNYLFVMIKILFLLKVEAEVPPEIINNVGSLQYRLGKHEVRASHILTARWL